LALDVVAHAVLRLLTRLCAVRHLRLRVNGVRGLWVADASVMPSVPRGHPNSVVAMIAHRAADMIAADLPA
jgi:choline dehydrogenase